MPPRAAAAAVKRLRSELQWEASITWQHSRGKAGPHKRPLARRGGERAAEGDENHSSSASEVSARPGACNRPDPKILQVLSTTLAVASTHPTHRLAERLRFARLIRTHGAPHVRRARFRSHWLTRRPASPEWGDAPSLDGGGAAGAAEADQPPRQRHADGRAAQQPAGGRHDGGGHARCEGVLLLVRLCLCVRARVGRLHARCVHPRLTGFRGHAVGLVNGGRVASPGVKVKSSLTTVCMCGGGGRKNPVAFPYWSDRHTYEQASVKRAGRK